MKIIAFLIFISLCGAAGAQFPILKSVAWTGMMVQNLRRAPLKTALAKTFDGKHPCDLCRHISRMYRSEKKDLKQSVAQSNHFEFFPYLAQSAFILNPHSIMKSEKSSRAGLGMKQPRIPPPKNLLA